MARCNLLQQAAARRVRAREIAMAERAVGDDGDAVVETAPLRPNPVTQDEMDAGSVELF